MSFATLRDAFTDSFAGLDAAVYDYSPPVVPGPAIFIFPAEPYAEPYAIGTGRIRVRFRLTAAVPHNDNQGALGNLEDLILGILTNLPSGVTTVGGFTAPSMTQVGPSSLLVSELTCELVTTTGD